MTPEQKEQVQQLRKHDTSYARISTLLGLSANTVKSFCQRSGLGRISQVKAREDGDHCPQCGKQLQKQLYGIPSRKNSWTDEMKQRAREQALLVAKGE